MLMIAERRSRWRVVWVIVPIIMIVSGLYFLFVAFAPMFNSTIITGRPADATAKKLEQPAGNFGDRLFIPEINVDVPIGDGANALLTGAWHRRPQNGNPATGGNFVLAAHRFVMNFTPKGTAIASPFYNINKLKKGQRLYVDYQNKRYVYQINDIKTVRPNDVAIEGPSATPKMTLYSCTLEGSNDGRDVITATPVDDLSYRPDEYTAN